MKAIIYLLAFCLSTGHLAAAPVILDPDVKKPDVEEVREESTISSFTLQKLLEAGELKDFYLEAERILMAINGIKTVDRTESDIRNQLWTAYYCAAAPLVSLDPPGNVDWLSEHRNIDFAVKVDASYGISFPFYHSLSSSIVRKVDIPAFSSQYFAVMLKTLRKQYDPDIYQKTRAFRDQAKKNWNIMSSEVRRVQFENKMVSMELRSNKARVDAENIEQDFIGMLIRFYPGKTNTVKRYIMMAGYTEEEMYRLIDRTVGRVGKSAFLYRNRPKKYDQNKNRDQETGGQPASHD